MSVNSPDLAAHWPGRLRRGLWLGGSGVALFILVLAIGNQFIPAERAVTRAMLGHDFLAFYTAGHFLRAGQPEKMYDLDAVREFQHRMEREARLDLSRSFGPFWNPPFYAWAFVPLAALPYRTALLVWWTISGLCLIGAMVLLVRMLPAGVGWKTWGLVPLLILVSLPCQQAMNHGQNTFISLLILCGVVTQWRGGRATAAGLVAGLLLYKPQLGVLVAAVLVLTMGLRALLGFACTASCLLLLTAWSMPELMHEYIRRMPGNLAYMQEGMQYLWERHATFKAFWRLLIQGHETGPSRHVVTVLWWVSELAMGSLLASAVFRQVRINVDRSVHNRQEYPPHRRWTPPMRAGARDRLIAATIACMPLLMPFYFDYDLLLLAIPAVLLGSELCANGGARFGRHERWLVWSWVALYACMLVGPMLGNRLHVNLTVLMLAAVAMQEIVRTYRGQPAMPADVGTIRPGREVDACRGEGCGAMGCV